jgi:hypothetical protein
MASEYETACKMFNYYNYLCLCGKIEYKEELEKYKEIIVGNIEKKEQCYARIEH